MFIIAAVLTLLLTIIAGGTISVYRELVRLRLSVEENTLALGAVMKLSMERPDD